MKKYFIILVLFSGSLNAAKTVFDPINLIQNYTAAIRQGIANRTQYRQLIQDIKQVSYLASQLKAIRGTYNIRSRFLRNGSMMPRLPSLNNPINPIGKSGNITASSEYKRYLKEQDQRYKPMSLANYKKKNGDNNRSVYQYETQEISRKTQALMRVHEKEVNRLVVDLEKLSKEVANKNKNPNIKSSMDYNNQIQIKIASIKANMMKVTIIQTQIVAHKLQGQAINSKAEIEYEYKRDHQRTANRRKAN